MGHRRHSLSAFSIFFTGDQLNAEPEPGTGVHVSPDPDTDLDPDPDTGPLFELECPFRKVDSLSRADLREVAYELFFMSCRSSPGFGGNRASLSYFPTSTTGGAGDGLAAPLGSTPPKSLIKKALGLKTRPATPLMMGRPCGPNSSGKVRRPVTTAEIMRLQMRVTDKSDLRLRKTLTRCLVGQGGKRAEAIILPLELLRQLKSSEFSDMQQYHQWQRRQLKILEISILNPPFPFNPNHPAALRLREIIRSSSVKPLDNSKNSDVMRSLCDCVRSLACHNPDSSSETCHWIIGYPLCIHLYVALLHSIFDLREVTVVLDEVDELVELMKKTWSTLGINGTIHNLCFTWLLFRQYMETGEVEPDLMNATLAMLKEVADDAKRNPGGHDGNYAELFSGTLGMMKDWAERRALNYHELFDARSASRMEQVVSLAVSTSQIVGDDDEAALTTMSSSEEELVDYYIRSSIRNAFTKILDNGSIPKDNIMIEVRDDTSSALIQLAEDTEKLTMTEKEIFGPVLKALHPIPTAVAAVTVHTCFGIVLKQYLAKTTSLTNELVDVLQAAGKLEKLLVQVVVEDSVDSEDGGKGIVKEMIPYDADSFIANLLRKWIHERLRNGEECLSRVRGIESWTPMSKNEPYAKSAVDLINVAKTMVDEFFEIPAMGAQDDFVQDLAGGLESIFHEYTSFVAGCGSKQSCLPKPPPLTRCNQGSSFVKLWKKAAVRCTAGAAQSSNESSGSSEGSNPRPSASRSTQRLYVRLNTLHYLLDHLHALDKSLSFFSYRGGGGGSAGTRRLSPSYYFEVACSEVESAIHHVGEVAAYRLIFLDTRQFYEGLYVDGVAESRIHPRLVILKKNLALMLSILIQQAKSLAVKEVMKAAVEAFLRVLLAGGTERAFKRADHDAVVEDFWSLKEIFCACGEELVTKEVVDRETEVAEGVVGLMALPTETLLEEYKSATRIASAAGRGSDGEEEGLRTQSPTGRWNRADPNTLLRVLCHRDDSVANEFLKRTLQLPRRR